jgi:hypothetical protein
MEASAPNRDEMYEQLLAISRKAFCEGSFEVAFHALSAAMHRAKDLKSLQFLRELFQEAEQQMQLINTGYPEHPLSSSSAASRKHESIYRSLQLQISTQLRFLEMQGVLQDHSKQQEDAHKD